MAKGWTKVETVNNTPKKEKISDKKWSNFINNTKTLSIDKLKERADEDYEIKILKEDYLLEAFKNKRLKSKNLIKQAIRIKKIREAKEKENTQEN